MARSMRLGSTAASRTRGTPRGAIDRPGVRRPARRWAEEVDRLVLLGPARPDARPLALRDPDAVSFAPPPPTRRSARRARSVRGTRRRLARAVWAPRSTTLDAVWLLGLPLAAGVRALALMRAARRRARRPPGLPALTRAPPPRPPHADRPPRSSSSRGARAAALMPRRRRRQSRPAATGARRRPSICGFACAASASAPGHAAGEASTARSGNPHRRPLDAEEDPLSPRRRPRRPATRATPLASSWSAARALPTRSSARLARARHGDAADLRARPRGRRAAPGHRDGNAFLHVSWTEASRRSCSRRAPQA